ncbi:MAG: CPBP family intramembrane glutamic endopeptidase [Pyrinomonadaceae bacterium]
MPAGKELPSSTWALKLLSLIQPTILLSLAVFAGVALASKVGLTAPVAEAAAAGRQLSLALKPQLVPGLLSGITGGAAILLIWFLCKPFLPPKFVTQSLALGNLIPLPTRLLYSGFTEELLLRWGVMTLLVWAPWRLFQRGQGKPGGIYFASAILISSVVFGLGHLPIAFALSSDVTAPLVFYIIAGNTVFGLIAGYLYWKKGLEAAMIAHMMAHVVLVTATHFGPRRWF